MLLSFRMQEFSKLQIHHLVFLTASKSQKQGVTNVLLLEGWDITEALARRLAGASSRTVS